MFAVVRTGGKQYRVAAGDKIVVDKIDGEAGARVSLGDVIFTGGGDAVSSVAAEIIAQAKGEKVIVFKKKRRHNYRRKAGHRQQHTILKILSVGESQDDKPKAAKAAAETPVEAAPAVDAAPAADAPKAVKAKAPKAAPAASDDAVAAAPVKKAATKKAPAAKPATDQE
jgi:large subunit ribosomal protein L21